jgi:hypothetical protein
MTTKRSDEAATIFSRVCAAPPPLTIQPSGAIWSAPSMATSRRAMPVKDSTASPSARASSSVRREVRDGRARAEPDGHPVFHELGGGLGRDALLVFDIHAVENHGY